MITLMKCEKCDYELIVPDDYPDWRKVKAMNEQMVVATLFGCETCKAELKKKIKELSNKKTDAEKLVDAMEKSGTIKFKRR